MDLEDSSQRVSDVPNTCGGGEFDGCEGRIRLFLNYTLECVSESVMLQKTHLARAGSELNKGNFLGLSLHGGITSACSNSREFFPCSIRCLREPSAFFVT